MASQDQEQENLREINEERQYEKKFKEPPELKSFRRPYKGIFLTYFLLFVGLLFFFHGFHRYQEYTVWDLISVWILSILLLIPGIYFSCLIFAIEMNISGFRYENHPELYK